MENNLFLFQRNCSIISSRTSLYCLEIDDPFFLKCLQSINLKKYSELF